MDLPDRFAPYEDASQPRVPVEGYPNTVKRSPTRAAIRRPFTRTDITGPLDLSAKLKPGDVNLAVVDGRPAQGSLIHVSGRVLDEDGRPVRGAIVEMWQANAGGRYFHPNDQRDAPLDPNFIGNGRCRTDEDGRYAFFTIKPGAYPVPNSGRWWRPPHIHFSVLGSGTLSRLVTQMYFPGDPLNAFDRLILAIPDTAAQQRLVATQAAPWDVPGEWLDFGFDMVLRGRHATPPLP